MAKLKGPLFSFDASGALADALVYFPWKGLSVVRKYVIPANPKTTAQNTQRGYVTEAVNKVHAVQILASHALDAADIAAYASLALTEPSPRTWFNEVVKKWVDCRVATKIPVIYSDGTISDPSASSFDCILYINEKTASQLAAGKFYFGTSKTALINSSAATVEAGTSVALADKDLSAFLSAGTKYFMQFRPDAEDPCEGAVSGIFTFTAT